jgi:hypothetical protein
MSGTAADNLAVTQVTWSTNRGAAGTATGTAAWSIAAVPLSSGATVITVVAHDAANNGASATLTVTYNTAPVAATLVAPTGTITTTTPAFTWQAVTGATGYQLWVNDASQQGRINIGYAPAPVGCQGGTATCTVNPGVALAAGPAMWWVRTVNGAGEGAWSSGLSFIVPQPVGGIPPGPAVLLAPGGSITTQTPTYTWQAVSGATDYQLWINDASQQARIDTTYSAAAAGCAAAAGICSVTPAVALAAGSAMWWIRTANGSGAGTWSTGRAFTVPPPANESVAPGPATLIFPGGTITMSAPPFTWQAVSGATHYQLWVNDASQQARVNTTYTAAAAGCPAGTGTCVINPGVSLAPGAALWWIRTANSADQGAWSNGKAFTVSTSGTSVTAGR